ncbi:unnamed protein product [Commensalibacter communis]|uniref:Uncharacterized protein n=1 Tax=Commensalibacter communis TaxID=2972786 RepID=A0A9W4TQ87_9PROT|nr:hypothetical protein [Commensalibacter communis]CAI3953373.1 unnamed protein product [Commensalibacter communis]CAI3956431.1 unnamed protein product [Commensalibacter communis]CAI3956806.1 unnamed protein product [Commensalibacter communis]CAI3957212.1 unnamed protein product [Commensalibacter communis]
MKKLLLASVLALALPSVALAAPQQSNTTMTVDYENVQQLIKNQYAAREGCRSIKETPETSIMCQYADAASAQLTKLGYCYGDENQSMADSLWKKCSKSSKKQ